MPKALANPMVRARVDPKRKRNVEQVLASLGITPGQAINMLYAQIERRRSLPPDFVTADNSEVLPHVEQVAAIWAPLDDTDYSYLAHP